jgi:hypothetical protein
MMAGLVLELGVVPILVLWQRRIANRSRPAWPIRATVNEPNQLGAQNGP